ncbi:hypothetical protein MPTK1_5g11210 [Marchantia polymorpha subsp. ruderalis]|uniref:Uncharacterized protein n=2 Tax=Marchantia polymorpha TaxID=3197 RepID=A0AAF6BH71_MARPO|nr:hypothetical protein MARPO_0093s0043 [Marchantia polymorpha]BBN11355.1 hypothetical protein Mp_5g11210 [Marchantia polymorpha subsp. ruderalis]|eukprot:PTQ32965.1 hypothetical protein MARPO_0093s0043 [Marchantia polymorpha]
MAHFDPSDVLERQRIERKRYLESKVAETLAFKPSKPGANLKRAEHGTYKLSPDEEKQAVLEYQRQSRQARILQEMLHAAACVGEFRQRKKRDKQKLLQVLREAWEEEQAKRKAELEADYLNSCKGIGQSHDAAQLVAQNLAIIAEQKAKEAEESKVWGTIRFQKAMQEENARKQDVLQEQKLAKGRRKVLSETAAVDRRRARIHASFAKPEVREEEKLATDEEEPETYLRIGFNKDDIRRNFIQSRLPGTPNDYKDTYFHSRFSMLKDRSNFTQRSAHADEIQHEAEVDAWKAAEAQMKNVEMEKERKAELEEVWRRRKAERGHAAAAKLQKIASLEKELVVELEEEQERKRQLEAIEELTRAIHSPVYKPDSWRRLQSSNSSSRKETNKSYNARPGEIEKKGPEADDASRVTDSRVSYSDSKETVQICEGRESVPIARQSDSEETVQVCEGRESVPIARQSDSKETVQVCEGRESVPIAGQATLPVIGDDLSVQESSSQRNLEGRVKDDKLEAVCADDERADIVKSTTSKEERSVEEMTSNFHSSQVKVPGLNFSGFPCKLNDKNGTAPGIVTTAKHFTPRSYSSVGSIKATKDVRSSAKVSSLSSLSRKSGIRKGNKSPQKHEIEQAPNVHEYQDAADYIKEFKVRSKALLSDQARPSANMVDKEKVGGKVGVPGLCQLAEGCGAEARKKSPRKESSNWLSNILEKFHWWKCDSSPKEFSCPGVGTAQGKLDVAGRSSEQADRLHGLENVGKSSTPRTKQLDEPLQESSPTRKTVPFRIETLGSLNTLRETDWYCEEQPGWSEARTKVVFTKEELEALKLELYGTLTGETITSQQRKVILRKEKVRHVSKSQGLHMSLFPQHAKDMHRKVKSAEYENDQHSRSFNRGLEHSISPAFKLDKTKLSRPPNKIFMTCPQDESIPFTNSQSVDECLDPGSLRNTRNQNHDKKPLMKDSATQYTSAEFECAPKQEQALCRESIEERAREVKTLVEIHKGTLLNAEESHHGSPASADNVNLRLNISASPQDAVSSVSIPTHDKGKGLNELTSARQVAEELIRAWRAGQLGGDVSATFSRTKESPQVSRKRRAATVEEVQVSASHAGTRQKLGQLREKINRPQQNSATKLRKWDVLTPSSGGINHEKKDSNVASPFKRRDLSRNTITSGQIRSPMKTSLQHRKEEHSLLSSKKYPEEATNMRVEDVSEGRSLDFILGSLSAQVRELDERLQYVTACSLVTKDGTFVCTPGGQEEQKPVSDEREVATSVPSANRVTHAVNRSGRALQHTVTGESERIKRASVSERERTNGGKTMKPVGPSPPISPHKTSKEDGNFSSLQGHQEKTNKSNTQVNENRLGGSTVQAQSPESSMEICIEDMTNLMQEINRQPACGKKGGQILQDSFLENLPRRCESGTIEINQEDVESRRPVGRNKCLEPASGSKSQESRERFSFKLFADICSGKAELATLDEMGTSDADKRMTDGMTTSPRHAATRVPLRQAERISLSSLDLEEAMRLHGTEEHMLLSSSVDFSPWNTANLPDVFTSISDVGRRLNYSTQVEPARLRQDNGSKLEHCHLKESSKYLLKNNEFKKKCKAFEKKRLGRGKGKQKKSVRKPFNPMALPPKHHHGCHTSKSNSTRSLQTTPQPGALSFSTKDMKLTKKSQSNSKLTSRSLPEEFPLSVAAEEVQKWLRRDATGCSAMPPDDVRGRRRGSYVKYPQFSGSKRPQGFEGSGTASPPLVMTTPGGDVERFDRRSLIKRDLEARRRPSSAGIVMNGR